MNISEFIKKEYGIKAFTFNGKKGYLTKQMLKILNISDNSYLYYYAGSKYQDKLIDNKLKLIEGEDWILLDKTQRYKLFKENGLTFIPGRNSTRFWFESSIDKFLTYRSKILINTNKSNGSESNLDSKSDKLEELFLRGRKGYLAPQVCRLLNISSGSLSNYTSESYQLSHRGSIFLKEGEDFIRFSNSLDFSELLRENPNFNIRKFYKSLTKGVFYFLSGIEKIKELKDKKIVSFKKEVPESYSLFSEETFFNKDIQNNSLKFPFSFKGKKGYFKKDLAEILNIPVDTLSKFTSPFYKNNSICLLEGKDFIRVDRDEFDSFRKENPDYNLDNYFKGYFANFYFESVIDKIRNSKYLTSKSNNQDSEENSILKKSLNREHIYFSSDSNLTNKDFSIEILTRLVIRLDDEVKSLKEEIKVMKDRDSELSNLLQEYLVLKKNI